MSYFCEMKKILQTAPLNVPPHIVHKKLEKELEETLLNGHNISKEQLFRRK